MTGTYELFKREFFRLSGLDLDSYNEKQMKRRIEAFMIRSGYSDYTAFSKGMKQDTDLFHSFISYLTINVSLFFRNPDQWKVFENKIIPILKKKRDNVHIWSAACARGEEPYSLSMCMANNFMTSKYDILATDFDSVILERAKTGEYKEDEVKSIPKEYMEKYVVERDGMYYMRGSITGSITFKKHDLLSKTYPTGFDFIACRNVTIYFTDKAKDAIYKKLSASLNPGGILFIGSTEQIKHPEIYGFKRLESFFYQKMEDKS